MGMAWLISEEISEKLLTSVGKKFTHNGRGKKSEIESLPHTIYYK